MFEKLGTRLTLLAHRYVPDPFVLALLLTLMVFGAALIYTGLDVGAVLTAWIEASPSPKDQGFWNLLAFGMQMCLILVTGHALAESPPVARLLGALADRARTPASAVVVVAVAAMLLALVNWGLGLIAGALLARRVGQRAREHGIRIHYPLVVAAGYTGLLVWHGGLSGSAPLKVTLNADLAEVLGADVAARIGSIPISETIGSVSNIGVNLVLLILVPWVLLRMLPADESARVGAPAHSVTDQTPDRPANPTPAQRLDRSAVLTWAIVIPGVIALFLWLQRQGLGKIDLNLINFAFLIAGLILHRSAQSYVRAIGEGARGCAGIILQFPFYAGIMGVLVGTGLLAFMAAGVAELGSALLPAVGFYSAGLVNLFVPSGGGQWAIQGPLLVEAGLQTGVQPSRMVMALAYGDQWTNMLQPFWALPLLAITGVEARDIVGYTAVLLIVSQVIFLAGLYLVF
jgi:short-chain fatty acids transporter